MDVRDFYGDPTAPPSPATKGPNQIAAATRRDDALGLMRGGGGSMTPMGVMAVPSAFTSQCLVLVPLDQDFGSKRGRL